MSDARSRIEGIARLSYGRLVASLALRIGSIARAEDALGDALLRALETWPDRGIPDNPEGWLLTAARNKAVDRVRSEQLVTVYGAEIEMLHAAAEAREDTGAADPWLALMFACAHPAIDARLRAPLMLQVVLGLDARRMAPAYLLSPGTLAQRLTRAKAKIETSGIPLTLPEAQDEYDARLEDILAAIYAAYAVGQTGSGSGGAKAVNLTREALWLISTLCDVQPMAAEAHGLFALILYAESRRPARTNACTGQLVPLREQDPALWAGEMMADADRALRTASRNLTLGRFQIEASIQAVHMARRDGAETDWRALQLLYRGLVQVSPTVGAMTGQAAVEAEISGPEAGLRMLDAIEHHRRDAYQPWHATRAHLLAEAGQAGEAMQAFDRAIGLSDDAAERAFLLSRKAGVSCRKGRP